MSETQRLKTGSQYGRKPDCNAVATLERHCTQRVKNNNNVALQTATLLQHLRDTVHSESKTTISQLSQVHQLPNSSEFFYCHVHREIFNTQLHLKAAAMLP